MYQAWSKSIFHSIIRIFTTDVSLHLLYFILLLLEYLLQMYLYICYPLVTRMLRGKKFDPMTLTFDLENQ
jgi:hypothetical protein